MNRNRYRLVFNRRAGMLVPQAETTRGRGKGSTRATPASAVLATLLGLGVGLGLAGQALAELPTTTGSHYSGSFATYGQASYQTNGSNAVVSQVGNKSILNWNTFNISAGNTVTFQQVDSNNVLVPGASFTSLNRVWDANPSVIAGQITTAAGQTGNITLVNQNGIAFMNGAQVNLNSFTASSLPIADHYITDSFLPGDGVPQFAPVGSNAATGFVKVFEGANITAGSQGRVMLIAPTVVNQGTITAPDGQIILAAGSQVYLQAAGSDDPNVRGLLVEINTPSGLSNYTTNNASVVNGTLDGQSVNLQNVTLDNLGAATNTGTLSTPHGNITMIGYAVNQMGLAQATTSVVANGSVFLLAKDQAISTASGTVVGTGAARSGQVVFGPGSVTQVLPDVADQTTSVDGTSTNSAGQTVFNAGLGSLSQITVVGQTIHVSTGATVNAPAGDIQMYAVDNPSSGSSMEVLPTSVQNGILAPSATANLQVDAGATISVAGLQNVQVSAGQDTMAVQLRGNELQDSPLNQSGPVRGMTVYVDVVQALANAYAGMDTLISTPSLVSYVGEIQRTVAQRSTIAGTVSLYSQGQEVVAKGATLNLSGGSVQYTPTAVNTTYLVSNGNVLTTVANALGNVRYTGTSTSYVVSYAKWGGVQDVYNLGQSLTYLPGYTQGMAAGALNIFGANATYFQGTVLGNTTIGSQQLASGNLPAGAQMTVGYYDAVNKLNLAVQGEPAYDYRINQNIVVDDSSPDLPDGFTYGDTLPANLQSTLNLNADLVGVNKVSSLTLYNNNSTTINSAISAPQGGALTVVSDGIAVNASLSLPSGSVSLLSQTNYNNYVYATVATEPTTVSVADNVSISTAGSWINRMPGVAGDNSDLMLINGGSISITAQTVQGNGTLSTQGTVALGSGDVLDASGGGAISSKGVYTGGKGGSIALSGFALDGINNNLSAYGASSGGSLSLTSDQVLIGNNPVATAGVLNLAPEFFTQGGFANYTLTAQENITLAAGTVLTPRVSNLIPNASRSTQATGSNLFGFSNVVEQNDYSRQAVNLTLNAAQSLTTNEGVVLGQGSQLNLDNGAALTVASVGEVDLLGSITAHGGTVSVAVDGNSSLLGGAGNALWLGAGAQIDVSGIAVTYTGSTGLLQGKVLAGGTVSLLAQSGTLLTGAGSMIDLDGAGPVTLGILNASGTLGQSVSSDAGSLVEVASSAAYLDGSMSAHGSVGGSYSFTLGQISGAPTPPDVSLVLAASVAAQTGSLQTNSALPAPGTVRATIGADKLQAAGFDTLAFSSSDAIVLQSGLNLASATSLPLRNVQLDTARVEASGNATITAQNVEIGNFNTERVAASGGEPGTSGAITIQAQQMEIAGNLEIDGPTSTTFTGLPVNGAARSAATITLAGETDLTDQPSGYLQSSGNLVFNSTLVAPSTDSVFAINAPGQQVTFESSGAVPVQPLSALGNVSITAQNIVQDGALWAPMGQLAFNATGTVSFGPGSLTSVAANLGSVIPFGQLQNGTNWIYQVDAANPLNGDLQQVTLGQKSIQVNGASVNLQAGATVSVAGGGDLMGYEFTVGPGGSHDILTDTGTLQHNGTTTYSSHTYAIVPSYTGGTAPIDAQETPGFITGSGSSVAPVTPGAAIYLAGVPGLPAGTYTLLPAHYALLPGAFAVVIPTTATTLMPSQAYTRADGIYVASATLTDTRANAPAQGLPEAVQVLSRAQVLARSQITETLASNFFAGSGGSLPADAGLVSLASTAQGGALNLNGTIHATAAAGGQGGQLDLSAPDLEIVSSPQQGLPVGTVQLTVDQINAVGAQSVLLGGVRNETSATTGTSSENITVGTTDLTLANDATHPLQAGEVMLAANDTIALGNTSAIVASGAAVDTTAYTITSPNAQGAFVRAATSTASEVRVAAANSVAPVNALGTLCISGTSCVSGTSVASAAAIAAASAITLDATASNLYSGATNFVSNGVAVAGNLTEGAQRISFGGPTTGLSGLDFSQAELTAMDSLQSLDLISYSSFDLYGNVQVGAYSSTGGATLQRLVLQGGGLASMSNTGVSATVAAKNLTLSNQNGSAIAANYATGGGTLNITADTLTLAAGYVNPTTSAVTGSTVQGYTAATVTANEIVGSGTGSLTFAATAAVPVTIDVARISGASGSSQSLISSGAVTVDSVVPSRTLAAVDSLGAAFAVQGSSVDLESQVVLPSGSFSATATAGNVQVGTSQSAGVDVSGRVQTFDGNSVSSWGGNATLTSAGGNVTIGAQATVNVSGATGASGGTLALSAVGGNVSVAAGTSAAPTIQGSGSGAQVTVSANTIDSFSSLNTAWNNGGFAGERSLRVIGTGLAAGSDSITVASTDVVTASNISLEADNGSITLQGTLNASGAQGGSVQLAASNGIAMSGSSALINASSTGTGNSGGSVEFDSTSTAAGALALSGGTINVAAGAGLNANGNSGTNGTVLLRALRTGVAASGANIGGSGVTDVATIHTTITGASAVDLDAVKVYSGISTMTTGSGTAPAGTLYLSKVQSDNTAFHATAGYSTAVALGTGLGTGLTVLDGVEVDSGTTGAAQNIALSSNWTMGTYSTTATPALKLGLLTVRAVGNVTINADLSDGFSVATPCTTATCSTTAPSPALLSSAPSWSFQLVAGAQLSAAAPLDVASGSGNIALGSAKLVRTGTGSIALAAGGNISLASGATVYTAGDTQASLSGFTAVAQLKPVFAANGGNVSLLADGNITGTASTQLYSEWLYRQGATTTSGAFVGGEQTAWWVRFDQFNQGVGALAGGNVTVQAGGNVSDLSASVPTEGRVTGSGPGSDTLVQTGGGNVTVQAGGNLLGGEYYADSGQILLSAGASVLPSNTIINNGTTGLAPVLALGDAQATVRAADSVSISSVINPLLLGQAAGNLPNVVSLGVPRSEFSTYSSTAGASLLSLTGNVNVAESSSLLSAYHVLTAEGDPTSVSMQQNLYYFPSTLSVTAFQGAISLGTLNTDVTMAPSATGNLSLLAQGNVTINSIWTLSDSDPALVPSPLAPAVSLGLPSYALILPTLLTNQQNPLISDHAVTPVHAGTTSVAQIDSTQGSVMGVYDPLTESEIGGVNLSMPVSVQAAVDVRDFNVTVEQTSATQVSSISAGRDVSFDGVGRRDSAYMRIDGPGTLSVTAGRNIDLGTSGGIESRGNLDDANLSSSGANIALNAGVGNGGSINYAAALATLAQDLQASTPSADALFDAEWLTGQSNLTPAQALAAVQAVQAQPVAAQDAAVRNMVYTALLTTGRDYNNAASPYFGDYSRGYAALDLLFPGMDTQNANGTYTAYTGSINMFASRVKTDSGGNIEFMVPGGGITVGLANTPESLVGSQYLNNNVLGMVVVGSGDINGFTRDSMLVNQSRILTVGGGNVLLWSSEGDIDAGAGKKSASSVPPPLIEVDANGNVTQVLQGAVGGSGIGALSTGSVAAGSVDLDAPKGTVNAGDAGIRAGNINIAAAAVVGADNISASGSSTGVTVVDNSGVTAAAAGGASAGDMSKAVSSLASAAADSAAAAQALADSFIPSYVRVDVIGFGDATN